MKHLKIVFTISAMLLVSGISYSQDMMLPEPVKSPVFDSMSGTWVSEPYEMMGMKMKDEVTQTMILNGQFMKVDIISKSDQGFTYEALGIMAPDKDGSFTGWMYDVFGKNGITTYTGKNNGMTSTMTGISAFMTEKREIIMDGDTMIQNVSFVMKDASGKEMPEMKMTINYKKKN